ncbi:MAG: hypothetical protein V7731_16200 [Amphritea sp.]
MYFLITAHKLPLFYRDDANHPVEVNGIDYVYEKTEIDANGLITFRGGSEPMINDPMQAISVLHQHGIPGYKNRDSAKMRAKELGLQSYKYLKIS